MAINFPISTVAVSVHNAIAMRGPMTPAQALSFLRIQWQQPSLEDYEVAEASAELLSRGYVSELPGGFLDTVIRNAEGKRCPAPPRQRTDPNSATYGWW